jgi:hypothetical protein
MLKMQEKPVITSKTTDLITMLNYVEDSAALLETHEDRNVFDLLWCNKKFEKSLELTYFSANQAFDFRIFKFEAVVNQATKESAQMTLYKLENPAPKHKPCEVKSLQDIVREFKLNKSTTSSQLFFLTHESSMNPEGVAGVMLKVNLKVVERKGKTWRIMLEISDQSEIYKLGRQKLQLSFQTLLTNALSHERLTPLNAIINLSDILIKERQ